MKPSEQRKQAYWIWQEYERSGSLEYLQEPILEDPSFLRPQIADQSLLDWAIHNGDVPAVKLLLRLGFDVNSPEGSYDYLHSAIECETNPALLVEMLLKAGANPSLSGIGGRTALHHAAMRGVESVLPVLIAHGAEINSRTNVDNFTTPLMEAAKAGHLNAVRSLLKLGADPTLTDQPDIGGRGGGRTAANFAEEYKHPEIAECLTSWK